MSATKKSGQRRAAQDTLPLQPADALILLRSAVNYLLQAGLRVGARNGSDGLILTVAGAQVVYHTDGANFVPQSRVPHSDDVPQPVPHSAG